MIFYVTKHKSAVHMIHIDCSYMAENRSKFISSLLFFPTLPINQNFHAMYLKTEVHVWPLVKKTCTDIIRLLVCYCNLNDQVVIEL